MHSETFDLAVDLDRRIRALESATQDMEREFRTNPYNLPAEMMERHAAEIRAWMAGELARVRAGFAAL